MTDVLADDLEEELGAGVYPSQGDPRKIIGRYFRDTPPEARAMNLGCGGATIPGWINIDADYPWHQTVLWDLSKGLPFIPDNSIAAIHSEHFVEHIPRAGAITLMRDCFRCLTPGGVLRIAMPDLDDLVRAYVNGGTLARDTTPEDRTGWDERLGPLLYTPGELLNVAMREWGHTYIYNLQDATLMLGAAGFTGVRRMPLGVSAHPLLQGREQRSSADHDLIIEVSKL